jgi:hypothetical protein
MIALTRILVATDFSEPCEPAVERSIEGAAGDVQPQPRT